MTNKKITGKKNVFNDIIEKVIRQKILDTLYGESRKILPLEKKEILQFSQYITKFILKV